MIAIVCPGQGSQRPGFLARWMELPSAAESLRRAAEVTGVDVVGAGTAGDDDAIRDTAVAQPLIVAATLAGAAALGLDDSRVRQDDLGPRVAVAGHSVGEIAAAALAGAVTTDDALRFVAARGRAMAAAAAIRPTGMAAVLGGEPAAVEGRLERYGLVAANVNGAGQVVAAGPVPALHALTVDPPPGARVMPLRVAGAFHSPAMEPARGELERVAAGLGVGDPVLPWISNADGAVVAGGTELLRRLVTQVTRPVRWDRCLARFRELGVTTLIELPPAGVLTGLAKRELRGVEAIAVRSPEDLDRARAAIAG